MAKRKPLILKDGAIQQLQVGDTSGQTYTEVLDSATLLAITDMELGDEVKQLDTGTIFKYSSEDGATFKWLELSSNALTFIDGGRSDSVYTVDQVVSGGNA